jgi:hypothetical protein
MVGVRLGAGCLGEKEPWERGECGCLKVAVPAKEATSRVQAYVIMFRYSPRSIAAASTLPTNLIRHTAAFTDGRADGNADGQCRR